MRIGVPVGIAAVTLVSVHILLWLPALATGSAEPGDSGFVTATAIWVSRDLCALLSAILGVFFIASRRFNDPKWGVPISAAIAVFVGGGLGVVWTIFGPSYWMLILDIAILVALCHRVGHDRRINKANRARQ